MNPDVIAQKAIEKLNKKITNEVFLIIQSDNDLMYNYLKAVEEKGLDVVNRAIGLEVKKQYKLVNINDREENPSCTLIQSHQKFE
jgi:hypothetical protein